MSSNIDVRDELQRIRDNDPDGLIPDSVVRAASNPNNPLHRHFEWNDSIAGHNYRLEQARHLIKIVVSPVTIGTEIVMVPSFQQTEPGQSYDSVLTIISDATRRKSLVLAALTRARDVLRNCPDPLTQKYAKLLSKEASRL